MDGKPVKVGSETYLVPDITVDAADDIMARIAEWKSGGWSPMKVAEVIKIAIRENYPDVTAKVIGKELKLKDSADVMARVLAAAGLQSGGDSKGEATSPSP